MKYDTIRELFAPLAGGTILVGYSGGVDSLAALLLARKYQREFHYRLTAIHCEHGLRGEAGRADAAAAARRAEELGVDFRRFDLALPQHLRPGDSVENAARAARQAIFEQLAARRPDTAVVLGHHAGDRRENLLLRLARGSNVSGLTGLRSRRRLGGVLYLRPLLELSRAELEEFVRAQGFSDWCNDASNHDPAFRRNALRHEILPLWEQHHPGAGAGLDRAAEVLEEDARYLEHTTRRLFRRHFAGREEWSATRWRQLPAALRGRMLRLLLNDGGGNGAIIPLYALQKRLTELLRLPPSPEGRLLPLPDGTRLELRGDTLRRLRARSEIKPQYWHWRTGENPFFHIDRRSQPIDFTADDAVWVDADQLPEMLLVSPPLPGDRLTPFGGQTPVKLKKLRSDRHLPADALPVVLRLPDGAILWAPGVRRSNLAPLNSDTGNPLCIRWKKTKNRS